MSLNWREIDLILTELRLDGCHIQDAFQPDFKSLVLNLYRPGEPFQLFIGLSADGSRLHRLTRPVKKPKTAQRFVELLRSRLRGGRIVSAGQLGRERTLRLDIERAGEASRLWIKLWGAASNMLLTEADGLILDAFYRRPKRGEASGGRFEPPVEREPASGAGDDRFSPRIHPAGSDFNAFIEASYGEKETVLLRERHVHALESRLHMQEAKIWSTITGLEKRLAGYSDFESIRRRADLLSAHAAEVKKGESILRAASFEDPSVLVEIQLDPLVPPRKQAEELYAKYKKAKAGRDLVAEEINSLKRTIERLTSETAALIAAGSPAELEAALQREKPRKQAGGRPTPGLAFSSEGYVILIGRTAAENDELLRRHVKGNDTWLHTRDCPGAYVFIKGKPGKSVPLETLLDAGNLAVFYSKARNGGAAELYYTQVKYLRRAKGERLGTVLPTHEKNLSIRLEQVRLDRLRGDKSD